MGVIISLLILTIYNGLFVVFKTFCLFGHTKYKIISQY